MIFDHQCDDALVQTEVTFRDPKIRPVLGQGRVESVVQSVFVCNLRITRENVANCRQNKFWCKGQRSQNRRRSYGPVVRPMGHSARDIVEKTTVAAIYPQYLASRAIAGRESPQILAVTLK